MASKLRNASHKSPSNNLTKPSQSLFFLFLFDICLVYFQLFSLLSNTKDR